MSLIDKGSNHIHSTLSVDILCRACVLWIPLVYCVSYW